MPPTITLTVLVFASLRERLGSDRCTVRLDPGATAAGVWPHLPAPIRRPLPPAGVRYAVNGDWAPPESVLRDGDQVALITPVSGG